MTKILANSQGKVLKATNGGAFLAPDEGSSSEVPTYTVTWFDYDGTILKQEEVNEGGSSTAPTVPTHQYLTFEEWVHGNTLTNIDQDYFNIARYSCTGYAIIRKVNVPAGETVRICATRKYSPGEVITVNWGDNTTSVADQSWAWDTWAEHTYSTAFSGYITMSTDNANNYIRVCQNSGTVENYVEEYYIPSTECLASYYWNFGIGNKSLKAVVLPNGLTSLPQSSFCNFAPAVVALPQTVTSIGNSVVGSIQSDSAPIAINIPSAVTSIGDSSFNGWVNTKYITKEIFATTIGSMAFRYFGQNYKNKQKKAIGNIKCSGALTSVGGGAFSDSAFKKIDISNGTYTSLTSTGGGCFQWCDITEEIKISSTVTTLGGQTFANCSGLISISGLTNISTLGNGEFEYCYLLSSPINLQNITTVGAGVFRFCYSIQSIKLGGTFTSLPNYGDGYFSNCYNLSELVIPSTVTAVGSGCFNNLQKLQSITLPSGLTTLDQAFMNGCYSLEEITLYGTASHNCLNGCYGLKRLHFASGFSFSGTSGILNNLISLEEISCDLNWVPNVSLRLDYSVKYLPDSIVSFFTNLGTAESSITLTFGSINLSRLTSAEKAIATDKGYTLA